MIWIMDISAFIMTHLKLFNIKNDPAELINLAGNLPDKVNELAKLYFSESQGFCPPVS
jgi:hypothetical protein